MSEATRHAQCSARRRAPGPRRDPGPASRTTSRQLNSPPDQAEAPEDFPWQANKSVYTYLPDCTDQGSPDIAIDAAQNLYAVWSRSRDGGSDGYFAYRPNGGAWGANVRVNDRPGAASRAEDGSQRDREGLPRVE